MKTFRGEGDSLTFTSPAGGVVGGTGVKIGDAFVIATSTVAATLPFVGQRTGIVEHAKVSAQPWSEGQPISWDNAAKLMTTVATGNFLVGYAAAVAANPSATGLVVLRGVNLGVAQ